jgi:uncharacterized protein (DUF2164 family)
MTIKLEATSQARFIESIKRYFSEQLGDDIGDLKASLLLEFVLREIGPTVYNHAVADAQTHMQGVMQELDVACYEPDPGYWTKK